MNIPSLLAYAGIYRAKLASSSTLAVADLTLIEELCTEDLKSECAFLESQKALRTILESFSGGFIYEEQRLRDAVEEYKELKVGLQASLKVDFQCQVAEEISEKMYPLTVTSGETLDKKAVLPFSPNGLFIQFPTASFSSFCRDRTENNITGEVECPAIGPCPFVDEVYFSFYQDCIPFSSSGCSQLYGFSIILNSEAFSSSTTDGKQSSGSHLVLCMLSFLPEFLFVKQVVINTAYVLCEAAADNYYNKNASRDVDELLRKRFKEVSAMVSRNSDLCRTFPGKKLNIPFFPSSRFLDLQRPGALLFQMINTPLSTLLLSFSDDAIRLLHTLLLSEARIIFLGCNPQHASACAVSAPSLVSPLKWVAPLIPYLPVDNIQSSGLLEVIFSPSVGHENSNFFRRGDVISSKCSEPNGFIIGCMGDLIPFLTLKWSNLAAAHGGVSTCSQIWIADARTGHIGVLPMDRACKSTTESPCDNFSTVALVPASNKLQKKYAAAIKETQRLDFRLIMSYFSLLRRSAEIINAHNSFMKDLLAEGGSKSGMCLKYRITRPTVGEGSDVYRFPNISESLIGEVHAAFLEFNTHRICGEYRKGLEIPKAGSIYQFSFNTSAFLEPQLHSSELARIIERTHMFKQFFGAILNFEVHGVRNVLGGLRKSTTDTSGSKSSSSFGSKPPLHPWGHSPIFQAELCLFYSRARNRFPELFPDFSGVNLSLCCLERINALLAPGDCEMPKEMMAQEKSTVIMQTVVSLAGTVSDGSPESKGSMQKWFSKASKAVKKLQNGETHFVFALPFFQGFISYGGCTVPSSTLSKIISSIPPLEKSNECTSPTSLSSVSSTLLQMEFKFPEVFPKKPEYFPRKSAGGSMCCRLSLDMIQNFSSYHYLLNPFQRKPCTSFSVLDEIKLQITQQKTAVGDTHAQYERMCYFSSIFPFSQRLWECINGVRGVIESSSVALSDQELALVSPSSKLNQSSQSSSPSCSSRTEKQVCATPMEKDNTQDSTPSLAVCAGSPSLVQSLPPIRPSLSELFDDLPPANISAPPFCNDNMMLDGFSSGVPIEFSADDPERVGSSFPSANDFLPVNCVGNHMDPNIIRS